MQIYKDMRCVFSINLRGLSYQNRLKKIQQMKGKEIIIVDYYHDNFGYRSNTYDLRMEKNSLIVDSLTEKGITFYFEKDISVLHDLYLKGFFDRISIVINRFELSLVIEIREINYYKHLIHANL